MNKSYVIHSEKDRDLCRNHLDAWPLNPTVEVIFRHPPSAHKRSRAINQYVRITEILAVRGPDVGYYLPHAWDHYLRMRILGPENMRTPDGVIVQPLDLSLLTDEDIEKFLADVLGFLADRYDLDKEYFI